MKLVLSLEKYPRNFQAILWPFREMCILSLGSSDPHADWAWILCRDYTMVLTSSILCIISGKSQVAFCSHPLPTDFLHVTSLVDEFIQDSYVILVKVYFTHSILIWLLLNICYYMHLIQKTYSRVIIWLIMYSIIIWYELVNQTHGR